MRVITPYPFRVLKPETMADYNGIWIGHGAIIMPVVTIGSGAIIAANGIRHWRFYVFGRI